MGFKTGALKTKYVVETGFFREEYTIFCAIESVSDSLVFVMIDNDGKQVPITIGVEDDCSKGSGSLIDCLYYLKHYNAGTFDCGKFDKIVIEDASEDEIQRVFI